MSVAPRRVVFLLDVDNTLLDNDCVTNDLRRHLAESFGDERSAIYWTIFEQLRKELGYADYLGALQRYRSSVVGGTRLLQMSSFLVDYPFAERLYPRALEAVRKMATLGPTVVFSDGDVVFQPRKIQRSGIWDAVEGRVQIHIHKEKMLHVVEEQFPADHYVMVDDKVRILAAMKAQWGDRLTTIFPRQGHYAMDAQGVAAFAAPDVTVERIGDLVDADLHAMVARRAR